MLLSDAVSAMFAVLALRVGCTKWFTAAATPASSGHRRMVQDMNTGEEVTFSIASITMGWKYLKEHPYLMALVVFKAISSHPMYLFIMGQVLTVEHELSDNAADTSFGVGLVMAGEAIGDLVVPPLALYLAGTNKIRMNKGLALSYVLTVAGFVLGALSFNVWLLSLTGLLAGASWGIQWSFSLTLIQTGTPNAVLGRVMSLMIGLHAIGHGSGAMVGSLLADALGMTARQLMWLSAAIAAVLGAAWTLHYMPKYNQAVTSSSRGRTTYRSVVDPATSNAVATPRPVSSDTPSSTA